MKKIERRDFLKSSLLGVGGLILTGMAAALDNPSGSSNIFFNPYEKVQLGNTQMKFSRVGLGTGMQGFNQTSNQVKLGLEKFNSLIHGCLDRGINWFDAADIYGSHAYLGTSLTGVNRDKYKLVSKIWFRQNGLPFDERPDADVVIQRFCKELKTDYLDLVLLHCMTEKDWPQKYEKQMKIMDDFKKKGIIRAHGVSCHSLDALKTAAIEPWVDSVHARINPYGKHMDGMPEVVVSVLKQFKENGKGVVGMKIMGAGDFRESEDKRNASVKYTLTLGCVDIMTVGFESLQETDDFAERVRQVKRMI